MKRFLILQFLIVPNVRILYYYGAIVINDESTREDYWRKQWQPTPVLLSGKSHGWRSLVGCSPWGREESDTTERLHFHFSLSCIGEGTGNPLQCSCLKNPRDGGAWWAAVYGVAQSRTRLKRLSSSSSSREDYDSTKPIGKQVTCKNTYIFLRFYLIIYSSGTYE